MGNAEAEVEFNKLLQDDFYRKDFAEFLKELKKKSVLLGALLEKIKEKKIELVSAEIMGKFFGEDVVSPFACGFFPQINKPLVIVLSVESIRKGYFSTKKIECYVAHELGHCLNVSEDVENKCGYAYGKFEQEPFLFRRLKVCTFKELRADEEAIKALLNLGEDLSVNREHIENLIKNFRSSFEYITETSRSVCEKKSSCPKYNEKKELLGRINRLLKNN